MLHVTVVDILTVANIPYPLAIKRLAVEHRHCRRRRNLSVARVTEPFSMRTIRRKTVVHIDQLRALVCGVQPIKYAVAAFKRRTLGQGGMYHFHAHNLGVAFRLEISERLLAKLRVKFTIRSVKHIPHRLQLTFATVV